MTTALVILLACNFVALSWFLLRAAQAETRLDLERVAEKMAQQLFRDYSDVISILDETTTRGYLRTKYMQLVSEYGLPVKGQERAVFAAWELIRVAQGAPKTEARGFAFYE